MTEKTKMLIEKFIIDTEKKNMNWRQIEAEEESQLSPFIDHYEGIGWEVISSCCFKTKHKKANIYVISFASNDNYKAKYTRYDIGYLILGIQKEGKDFVPLNTHKEEQGNLFRLYNMIDRQVSEVDDIIDDILDDMLY